jgi:hypothetical protein
MHYSRKLRKSSSSSSSSSSDCKPTKSTTYKNGTAVTTTTSCLSNKSKYDTATLISVHSFVFTLIILSCVLKRWAKMSAIQSCQKLSEICEHLHHPLTRTDIQAMVAGGATQYVTGWTCDKCKRNHSYQHCADPIFRCNICNIDVCDTCQGSRPVPNILDRVTYNGGYGYAYVPQQYFAVAPQIIPAMGSAEPIAVASPQYVELPPIDNNAQQERYY